MMTAGQFELARKNMVTNQIHTNNVTERHILDVLATLPRHEFVPEAFSSVAYTDTAIKVSELRYMLPPMTFSRLVQAARPTKNDTTLDIACATGYTAAVFSRLTKKVVAIENNGDLTSKANLCLNNQNVDNVITIQGELNQGHPDSAPYDIIFINGALKSLPEQLFEQLAEGGRLVTVVMETKKNGHAICATKTDGKISVQTLFETSLHVLEDF